VQTLQCPGAQTIIALSPAPTLLMNLFALSVTLHPKVVMLDVNESNENNIKLKLELFVML